MGSVKVPWAPTAVPSVGEVGSSAPPIDIEVGPSPSLLVEASGRGHVLRQLFAMIRWRACSPCVWQSQV
jgi:hypothetical protein